MSRISVSIVSHRHGPLLESLLADLSAHVATPLQIVLTLNVPEAAPIEARGFRHPLRVVRNPAPMGFGANHNAAFRLSEDPYFCVMNPDMRIPADPFPALLDCLSDPRAGVAAPKILNPEGGIEDSARRFPTPWSIARKAVAPRAAPDYPLGQSRCHPDWVAGMFMLLRRDWYGRVGGFDERYHLYYEDVDLCARLRRAGAQIVLDPGAAVIHDARRESRRNLRYARWHLASMARYFWSSYAARAPRSPSSP